MGDHKYQCNS